MTTQRRIVGRFGSSSGARGGPQRRSVWQGAFLPTQGLATGSTIAVALVDVPAQLLFTDGTVVRIRGALTVRPQTAANGLHVVCGITVVSDQAFTAGVTSMPDPEVNTSADWIWWKAFFVQSGADLTERESMREVEVDSKAMRILKAANKVLALLIRNDTGLSLTVGYGGRTLVKLH